MLKRFLGIVIFFVFICGGIIRAQQNDYVEREVNFLNQKLGLTTEQITRLKEILKTNLAEIEKLRAQNRDDRDAIRSAEKDIENTMRGQIQGLLTVDQQEKFAGIKETVRLPRPGQDERIKEMNERLKLTNEQSAQIEEIMMATRAKMDSLRGQTGDNWETGRSAMQKIRVETDQKIENILTAEQKIEYQKMKEERSKERHGPPPARGRNQHGL